MSVDELVHRLPGVRGPEAEYRGGRDRGGVEAGCRPVLADHGAHAGGGISVEEDRLAQIGHAFRSINQTRSVPNRGDDL